MELEMELIRTLYLDDDEVEEIIHILSDTFSIEEPESEVISVEDWNESPLVVGCYDGPEDKIKIKEGHTKMFIVVHEFVECFLCKTELITTLHNVEQELRYMERDGMVNRTVPMEAHTKTEEIKDAIAELMMFFTKFDDRIRDILMEHKERFMEGFKNSLVEE